MKLLIDIGNTSTKIAIAQGLEILHIERLAEPWAAALERLHHDYAIDAIVVSCVGKEGPALREALTARGETALWITHSTPCAICGVPEGYGADRLAADIGAYTGQHALLVVDAGTCITYDLIIDGILAGGVISPGVQLRLNAMHDYTAALPAIDAQCAELPPLMGSDTHGCMLSAALHGVQFEVEGYIEALRREHPDLMVAMTGGNQFCLSNSIEYQYDPLLVLRGLSKLKQ